MGGRGIDHFGADQAGAAGQGGGFDLAGAEDVADGHAPRQQVVGDDAPVATPPHGFRTHERAAPGRGAIHQILQPLPEGRAARVRRISGEAGVGPEILGRRAVEFGFRAAPAQRRQVPVVDSMRIEHPGQRIRVVLWKAARAGQAAHIHDAFDARFRQQAHELVERPRRMADGEYGGR